MYVRTHILLLLFCAHLHAFFSYTPKVLNSNPTQLTKRSSKRLRSTHLNKAKYRFSFFQNLFGLQTSRLNNREGHPTALNLPQRLP